MTVKVLDKYGNLLAADNSDQVALSVASGPGSLTGATTATVSSGIATFSNLVLDTAGSYTLGESATGGLTGVNSSSFIITAAGTNHLSFIVQPSNTTAGTAVGPAVKVEVLDQNDNLITSDNSDQVTLTIASGPGTVASGTTATVSGGIATLSNLVLDTAGSYTLAESATGGLSGANSSSFTVSPSTADHLAFGVQPSNTTAGSAINPAVTVQVFDKYGNLLTADNTDQVTLSVASGSGSLAGTTTASVSGGIATFTGLTLNTAGSYTLGENTAGGLTGPSSGSFTITAAGTNHLSFSIQPSNTTAGTAIGPAVKVEVLDPNGNLVASDNSDQVPLSLSPADQAPSPAAPRRRSVVASPLSATWSSTRPAATPSA